MPDEFRLEENDDSESDDAEYNPEEDSDTESSEAESESSRDKVDVIIEKDEAELKKENDKIWEDFLKEEPPKNNQKTAQPPEQTDKPKQNNVAALTTPQTSSALSFTGTKRPLPTKSNSTSGILGSALSSLKAVTGAKVPKLTTFEKTRRDWNSFVEDEGIDHELKSHNKGKSGYLERKAFEQRTDEREYWAQKKIMSKPTNRS